MCRRHRSVPCPMRYVGGTEEHARCARHTNSTKHYDLKGNISPEFSIDTFSNMQRLIVDVEQARKLKNTQTLGTQDPYVKLTLGRTMQKTRVHEDGGKLAVWNQKLIFKYINETKMLVQCMNSNTLSDNLIG